MLTQNTRFSSIYVLIRLNSPAPPLVYRKYPKKKVAGPVFMTGPKAI